jgi:hypothetical protein
MTGDYVKKNTKRARSKGQKLELMNYKAEVSGIHEGQYRCQMGESASLWMNCWVSVNTVDAPNEQKNRSAHWLQILPIGM